MEITSAPVKSRSTAMIVASVEAVMTERLLTTRIVERKSCGCCNRRSMRLALGVALLRLIADADAIDRGERGFGGSGDRRDDQCEQQDDQQNPIVRGESLEPPPPRV